ncbi:hypothetical protein LY76DRAFT_254287 [Colletotrichum caudatum]|nr:hypothetical protein LY76DRAFT_254287 [Colletotrichum caudatum]
MMNGIPNLFLCCLLQHVLSELRRNVQSGLLLSRLLGGTPGRTGGAAADAPERSRTRRPARPLAFTGSPAIRWG